MAFNNQQPAYVALRNIVAERTSSVVAWVGSGMSAPAGVPTWRGLRDVLLKELTGKAATMDEGAAAKLLQKRSAAEKGDSFWVAFQVLKDALGLATYRSAVREALAAADRASIPTGYKMLWRLRPSGILNLNLDRLATRAHSEVRQGRALNEFVASKIGESMHLLKAPIPFIANLHGIASEESSWVFTMNELGDLTNQEPYRQFLSTIFATKTVVFVGISADDLAVGGHLARLRSRGIETGSHFWITDRRDEETDKWAEAQGIRIIRYRAIGTDHSELEECLCDLPSFIAKDDEAPPVQLTQELGTPQSLPEPAELLNRDAEEIRQILNGHAVRLLAPRTPEAYTAYNEFCGKYDQAIYRAWYVTPDAPSNKLLGYTLHQEVAHGAFGRVFRAVDSSGDDVAIKVLREEVRRNSNMLQSFRRGVRSMHILSERKVEGMVAYREASEIPAFSVMDYVEGPNLREAVECGMVRDWPDVLRIAVDLATIIRRSHLLPERVLHRDIRPPNVMLKDMYTDPNAWTVVVLDFDLSWHRDAQELSVVNDATLSGYLAPEQVGRGGGASTRNALVDSFGVGMTLLYLRTGKDPVFSEHQHAGWAETLRERIGAHGCRGWASMPARYARLIDCATKHKQADRWDMAQVQGELQRLYGAMKSPGEVESAELIAEEIISRTDLGRRYRWDSDALSARTVLPGGVTVEITGRESAREVELSLSWTQTGNEEYRRIQKWISPAIDRAVSSLKKSYWSILGVTRTGAQSLGVGAAVPVALAVERLPALAAGLGSAVSELTFA